MGASQAQDPRGLALSKNVRQALRSQSPVVALESALITHGLPYPQNLETALEMEATVAEQGATPATVAVIGGAIRVGLAPHEIRALAHSKAPRKIGLRDFSSAAVARADGGTTVAATLFAAARAGIAVLATGGIGGVHRESNFDISADLTALGHTRMIVVCAGAKAILDIRATLEVLESLNVPVLGYGTDMFPEFYSPGSSFPVTHRADAPDDVRQYWDRHCALGLSQAVVVGNPIPSSHAIPAAEWEKLIQSASEAARNEQIHGPRLTPFLLDRVAQLSGRRSIQANRSLLLNNARVGAQIAAAIAGDDKEIQA